MKLYEISNELSQALELYQEDKTEEEMLELEKTLTSLSISFKEKSVAVAKYIINMDSDLNAIDYEKDRLTKIQGQIEKKKEWLKDYLFRCMLATDTKEIDGGLLKLKIKSNPPSVVIDDEDKIPKEYLKEKVVITVNKTAIKEAWKNGIGVSGTHIEDGNKRLEIK